MPILVIAVMYSGILFSYAAVSHDKTPKETIQMFYNEANSDMDQLRQESKDFLGEGQ